MELETKVAAAIGSVEQLLAALGAMPHTDPRMVAVARTQFGTAFLWAANAAGGEAILDGQ